MKLILTMTILFCANSHPITLISILIVLMLTSATCVSVLMKNSWLSLVLILIMLGGMLILFIYIASLAANEKFTHKNTIPILFLILVGLPSPLLIFSLNLDNSQLVKMFNTHTSLNNYLAIVYLLISLFVVIENISCYKAPLRSKM